MVCQHYRRRLHLSQVCPTRRSGKDCPFPPGGGRLGWGGRGAIGISLLATLLIVLTLSSAAHDELVLIAWSMALSPNRSPLNLATRNSGRRIVLDRDGGDCTICHAMPLPQREFHGTVGPPLDGIGRRATPGALRLRLVDPKAFNAETIMPAYYKVAGLHRVLDRYRVRPILTAQQIEDVIAYLLTLTD